jgi:hypothetical protein
LRAEGDYAVYERPGVTVAPNRVKIKAEVIGLQQDSTFSDKWHIDMDILDSESISGPNFARKGERAIGFAFEDTPGFSSQQTALGSIIDAEAEYVGDAVRGAFRLTRIWRYKI